ncbi:DUF6414 family protein [Nocardia thraciensis]
MDVLREYLYVDLEKVNGLASQVFDGLPEAIEESLKKGTRTQLANRNIGHVGKDRESDLMERRVLADATFPRLELDLEAQGYLHDISDQTQDGKDFTSGKLLGKYPAGSLVRITSQGRLVDPRYFARTIAGFATAAEGFGLVGAKAPDPLIRPAGSGNRRKNKDRPSSGGKIHRRHWRTRFPTFHLIQ